MDVQAILELMKEMKNSGIATLDWEADGQKLQLSRPVDSIDPAVLDSLLAARSQAAHPTAPSGEQAASAASAAAGTTGASAEPVRPAGRVVASPVVGVFYAAPSPDQAPFVSIGTRVENGAPLGIIEAMKLMNEVTSPCGGVIVDILIENAQRVEYGQPLFIIEEIRS